MNKGEMPPEIGPDLHNNQEKDLDAELTAQTETLKANMAEHRSNMDRLQREGVKIPLNDKVKEVFRRIGEYLDDEKVAMAIMGGAFGTLGFFASGPQAGLEGFGIGAGLMKALEGINPELKEAFEKSIAEKRQAREKRKQTHE